MMGISLINLSEISVLMPVIAGFIYYKNLPRSFFILLCFFCCSIFVELGSELMAHIYHNTMPLLHAFTVIEFIIFTSVFYSYFERNLRVRVFLIISILLLVFFELSEIFLFKGLWSFNAATRYYESAVLVLLALMFYYKFFKESVEPITLQQPMFWFSTAIFVYFSLNQFFFMLINYFKTHDVYIVATGIKIHAVINIFANLLFAISFRCYRTMKTY
ncbi:MAG: hypothetical protein H7296_01610 [Bacteroidia bacterium]|nr:hypothetical protein [Bacteroidia bacterium]